MKIQYIILLLFCLILAGCSPNTSGQYHYQVPAQLQDGLNPATLTEVGMDTSLLFKAMDKIFAGRYKGVHSVLIYTDNKLVLEEYFDGYAYKWDGPGHHGAYVSWDRSKLHYNMSVTKSITSACVGIAIDQGFIESVDQSIFDFLPAHRHLSKGKKKITIENLLTMTAGLQWKEWSAPYSSTENPVIGVWFQEKDPITYILEKPIIEDPGKTFNYSTGNMILLGQILKNATNLTIDDFSKKYLFEPLAVDTFEWAVKFDNGVDANTLKLRPRDMLKIGITFLDQGVWKGERIISKTWVDRSAHTFGNNKGINIPGEASGRNGYSYSWWIKTFRHQGEQLTMFSAGGWGGQHIMVIPAIKTVVVFTGGNYVTRRPPYKILKKFILPAIG